MKLSKLIIILVIAFTFVQCDPAVEMAESISSELADDATVAKIAKLGFDTQNFPVLKDGEYFTIEGDMNFTANQIDALVLNGELPQTEQRRFSSIVSCNEVRYITVFNNLPSGSPRNAVSLAMRHWNEISKCDLFFANTSNINSAEIIISNGSLPSGRVGQATVPSGGKPGRYIRLDINQFPSFSYAQWRSTIEHELGHCVGFAHTNSGSSIIPGTPSSDGGSLMNAGTGGLVLTLSGNDKKAARVMYNLSFSGRICN